MGWCTEQRKSHELTVLLVSTGLGLFPQCTHCIDDQHLPALAIPQTVHSHSWNPSKKSSMFQRPTSYLMNNVHGSRTTHPIVSTMLMMLLGRMLQSQFMRDAQKKLKTQIAIFSVVYSYVCMITRVQTAIRIGHTHFKIIPSSQPLPFEGSQQITPVYTHIIIISLLNPEREPPGNNESWNSGGGRLFLILCLHIPFLTNIQLHYIVLCYSVNFIA